MTTYLEPHVPSTDSRLLRRRRALCIVATVAALPYLVLKTAWLAGSTVGLSDPSFGHSTAMLVANGLTLGMDAAAVALAVVLGTRRGLQAPAWLVSFPMWVAYGLLGEILLVMPLTLVGSTVGSRPSSGAGPIDDWVYALVYGGFTAMGACLLPAFALYARERWPHLLGRRPVVVRAARGLLPAAAVTAVLAAASLTAAVVVGGDQARWLAVDGALAAAAALGMAAVVAGRPALRGWVATGTAFAGTGACFAWGLFHTVLGVVPNELASDGVPWFAVLYAAGRTVVGLAGGVLLARALTSAVTHR